MKMIVFLLTMTNTRTKDKRVNISMKEDPEEIAFIDTQTFCEFLEEKNKKTDQIEC